MIKYKKTTSLVLVLVILSVSVAPVLANGYSEGYLLGQQAAVEDYNGFGWTLAGGTGTLLFGLIGGGIVFIGSVATKPGFPPLRLEEIRLHDQDFGAGYREGYATKVSNIKTSSTLGGIAIGLIALLTISAR